MIIRDYLGWGSDWILKDDGEHFTRTPFGFAGIEPEIEDHTVWNAGTGLQLLGYLPIIGRIAGVARIALAIFTLHMQEFPDDSDGDHDHYQLKLHIIRGCCEIAGLGIALLITDIAVTCFKKYFSDQQE